MAQIDVTHSCGHTVTHSLLGRELDRDRKIDWLESRECSDCHSSHRAEEARRETSDMGLAALTGSEKQIVWAESIRPTVLVEIARIENDVMGLIARNPESFGPTSRDEVATALRTIHGELASQTAAKWWIDNRETFALARVSRRWIYSEWRERGLTPTYFSELAVYERQRRK